ncbi:hypothetical protein ACN24M_05760 [Streptomyces microflavus]
MPEQVAPAAFVPERVDRPAPPAARPNCPSGPTRNTSYRNCAKRRPRVEDEHALHDPGLMAAFRRGVDLAEAQTAQEEGPDTAMPPRADRPRRPLETPPPPRTRIRTSGRSARTHRPPADRARPLPAGPRRAGTP